YKARVYVTLNTILFDDELEEARRLVWQLYAAGVDALIVQDMAYLEMDLPPIALHASTQCDIRTPDKARRLAQAGFSQLVLPREFSTDQIREAADAAGVPVEVFVHGALCVSYSGDCQAGAVAMGRSANRGVCPQMCRLSYELIDGEGRTVGPEKHYLSLRDLCQSERLPELISAGASSFKIEGRLKDARYVANVTAAYSQALDRFVAENKGFRRSSAGMSVCGFTPDVNRTFNRGYTSYFIGARLSASVRMAAIDTPKWAGMPVAEATSAYDPRRRSFRAVTSSPLANGDGLGFFDARGRFCGFRLNRVEGQELFPASVPEGLRPGMTIYRNNDKQFFDILDRPDASCRRTISVEFRLETVNASCFLISAADCRGASATVIIDSPYSQAAKPQAEARRATLAKLGGTIYACGEVDDSLGDRFVPLSVLADARRRVIAMLDADAEACYEYDRRRSSALASDAFAGLPPLTYHDNVANHLARRFYERHGAVIAHGAIEVEPSARGTDVEVMNTRYCIRRELGTCLRTPDARKFPTQLYLRNQSGIYRLDFDCATCGMKVLKISSGQ
ncbi:MAG: U32 family peptidase, partial [Muribaculaceae bacterium]|nr:U32 family peptidase [Muribaculaceae bacterium]